MARNKMIFLFFLFASAVFAFLFSFPMAHDSKKPLADAASLGRLIAGLPLATPADERYAEFHGSTATPPSLTTLTTLRRVLGLSSSDASKRIEVDLTRQRVYAFEEDRLVHEFIVSTGKWGWTPTGEFTIWTKVRSQLMSGGSKALHTYYYLPNVPYVMFFYNAQTPKMKGFSFHGTYWHGNFGHPMSHGCINMTIDDAKTLYEWATPIVTDTKAWSSPATAENPGTRVVIYGTTPKE